MAGSKPGIGESSPPWAEAIGAEAGMISQKMNSKTRAPKPFLNITFCGTSNYDVSGKRANLEQYY
jgi:hypothetical protein